jgi:hypothetical protein
MYHGPLGCLWSSRFSAGLRARNVLACRRPLLHWLLRWCCLQLRDKPVATSEPPANDALLVPDLRPEMGAESSENASTELSTRVPWQSTAAEGSHEWDGATVSWRAAGLANTEGPFSWKRGITQDSGPLHDGTISGDRPPLPVPSGIPLPSKPGLPLFGPLPDARGRPIPLHPSPGGAPFPH